MSRLAAFLISLSFFACAPSESAPNAEPETPAQAEAPEAPEATEAPAPEAENSFGAALSDRTLTQLAEIAGDPERFNGQVVKTEGEITQVCQRMGCWMEMRSEGAPAVRVPMAGHNFFLPRDCAGRRATIEGEVAIRELSDAEREHLASEGAQAVAQTLQISATGVELH